MMKKINIILVLLLLLVSISAVSAAEDLNETVASDELVLEKVVSEDVSTSEDFNNEDTLSVSGEHTINSDNYGNFFTGDGELNSKVNSGDTIHIEGDFSNKNFIFKKPVNVVGTSSNNLKNCVFTFYSNASGSNISSLNIANNVNYYYGIFLDGASNCLIRDCTIMNKGTSSYTICVANGANYNNVTNNKLTTYGVREGYDTWSTPPLVLSGAHYNYIANNDIKCGDVNGIYLSSFSGGPLKGGNSNYNTIYNNTIKYNVLPTNWAYGIQLMGFYNIADSNTVIGAYLGISGGMYSQIINNKIINVTGADYNNKGVEIGGDGAIVVSSNSIVKNNTILNAKVSITGAGISVKQNCTVENNYVQVALKGIGISVSDVQIVPNIVIKNNTVITDSGAGISNDKVQVYGFYVLNNIITSNSGEGILIQKQNSKKMPGNLTVIGNTITVADGKYAINAAEADASMFFDISANKRTNLNSIIITPKGVYDPSKEVYNYKGRTHVITPETFDKFIVQKNLDSDIDDGDILLFEGEFSNQYICVNKAVKITGNNPVFYNTTFRVTSGGVWIENITINNINCERLNAWGVLVYNVTTVTILNCTINVYDSKAAYAIYLLDSSEIDVINNTLYSEGEYLTYTILANSIYESNIINNVILTNGTGKLHKFEKEHCTDGSTCTDGNSVCTVGSSVCTDGNANPGSHVLKEVYRTYGILMVYSSDNVVSRNKVTVTSKLNQTYSTSNSTNSLVGIDLYYDSHNNIFSENNVHVYGNDNYIYGMGVLGYYTTMLDPEGRGATNNQFIGNDISVDGVYCVEGIIVGSSSQSTVIKDNVININSSKISYGITLEMSQKSNIKNNNVTLNSQVVYGIEAFDSNNNIIENNKFKINSKEAYGFVFANGCYNKINSNKIFIEIEEGEVSSNISAKHADVIRSGNAGIYLNSYSSNNTLNDNNITVLKGYSIKIDPEAVGNLISNNYLNSPEGKGDEAIDNVINNTLDYNYINIVNGEFKEVELKYMENATLVFKTDDENLNGAKIEFIDYYDHVINTTTISNGQASFNFDFKGFEEYPVGGYFFYVKIYQYNYKVDKLTSFINIAYGDLTVDVANTTAPIARNGEFKATVKNILGNPVSGVSVKFWVIDEGYPQYIGVSETNADGIATVIGEIPEIYSENPIIRVDIIDPENYESTSAEGSLNAFRLTSTKIDINSNVYSGGVLAVLKDQHGNVLTNQLVSVKFGSNSYNVFTNSKGEIEVPVVSRGTYSVSISFNGDEQYYDSSNKMNLNVLSLISENHDYSVYYGNKVIYKIHIKDSNGNYGPGQLATIKVGGKTYHVLTDAVGYATLSIKLKSGTYTVAAEYKGDVVSNKIKFKPTLTAKNIVKKKAKKIKFSVKVVNKNGKPVKKKKVTFKIKGKKYTAKTNNKGVASVTLKKLKVGKYTITSSYGGCTIKNTIKIKK